MRIPGRIGRFKADQLALNPDIVYGIITLIDLECGGLE